VPIDGVGHQMHISVNWPPLPNIKQAFDDVAALGLENQVTELDMSLYTDSGECWSNPHACLPDLGHAVPNDVMRAQAQRYRAVFDLFEHEPSIKAVTFRGYSDKRMADFDAGAAHESAAPVRSQPATQRGLLDDPRPVLPAVTHRCLTAHQSQPR
jgi:GH35 family endo-1,4-beta-xylanase